MGQDTRRPHPWAVRAALIVLVTMALAGCVSEQSALHPAGRDAEALTNLFWLMTAGGVVIWCVVMGAAVYAVLGKKRPQSEWFADRFILIGGVAFPTITLALLLVVGLSLLPSWAGRDEPNVRIHVRAEQYWWRLGYEMPDGTIVETANELHLPTGTAEFVLTSTDVIHSFWIPALGGKMDAIPGRTNNLRLEPTKAGTYRGVCAEFCGPSHALMAFPVTVHEPDQFATWLAAEARPALSAGADAFRNAGCGSCHMVRGVVEEGAVGPDLTHFASRETLGAGTLPNTSANLALWLAQPDHVKPDVRMPPFSSLAQTERDAIIAFLEELE